MHAWLLDLYEHETDGLIVWVLLDERTAPAAALPLPAAFYAAGPNKRLHELGVWLKGQYAHPATPFGRATAVTVVPRAAQLLSV